jgi:hypothetical protein
MKRLMICILFLASMALSVSNTIAGDCYSDTVVKRWIQERDRAAERVVQAWAKGASPGDFAQDVAVIISNEFYVCSTCRDQNNFLSENLNILNNGSSPKVETVPAMILEHLVGEKILSPWRQFPADKRKGVARTW